MENIKKNSYNLLKDTNLLQVEVSKMLGINLNEFVEYYSIIARRFVNNTLNGIPEELYSKIDWNIIANQLYLHLIKHYFAGKVENII